MIPILRIVLELYFALSEMAGKSREERDALYSKESEKYHNLPDPSTLKDTEEPE